MSFTASDVVVRVRRFRCHVGWRDRGDDRASHGVRDRSDQAVDLLRVTLGQCLRGTLQPCQRPTCLSGREASPRRVDHEERSTIELVTGGPAKPNDPRLD